MLVGCYTLDCYCDANHPALTRLASGLFLEFPLQYTGETRAQCVRAARAAGWVIGEAHRCPICTGVLQVWGDGPGEATPQAVGGS
jgi:hypothetical protein